jgi:hypothetical protein
MFHTTFKAISSYFKLFQAISSYFKLFQAISSYLVLQTKEVLKFQVLFRTIGISSICHAKKSITISLNYKILTYRR